jgi:hypothetical protein
MNVRKQAGGTLLRRVAGPIVLGAAALLAVAAVAGAAIPDSDDGEIHGCYQKNQGQLRVIDAQAGQACRASEEPLDWNQQGVQGEPGPRGPSDAFSRWHDTEVAATDLAPPRLLELAVPDGNFATTGTAIVRNVGAASVVATCQTMHPSGDFDLAQATLAPGERQTLAMNPVGFSSGPGIVWLDCDDGGGSVLVSWMKITSIQVENLTNTPG